MCAKIKKKNNSGAKRLSSQTLVPPINCRAFVGLCVVVICVLENHQNLMKNLETISVPGIVLLRKISEFASIICIVFYCIVLFVFSLLGSDVNLSDNAASNGFSGCK